MTDDILRVVQRTAGVDFSAYRPQTAERRIRHRMTALGIEDLTAYKELLLQSSDEVQHLIARLTIKVSRFYRNAAVFDALRSQVLPQLARRGRSVRMWSAGCGCGEEAYTLAMLMEEAALAGDVVATDVDPHALGAARAASYDDSAVAELPASLAERFLIRSGAGSGRVEVRESVRSRVAFEHADLTAPSSKLVASSSFELICCRNVLIYWNAAAQRAILDRLLAHLPRGGWLCLGEAEWPDRSSVGRLDVVAARLRLFRSAGSEPQT
jgi:chemotaxis methyl-accepting protein methylase